MSFCREALMCRRYEPWQQSIWILSQKWHPLDKKKPVFCLFQAKKRTFDLQGRCKELPSSEKIVEVGFPTDRKYMGFNLFIFICLDQKKDSFVPTEHFRIWWAQGFNWSFSTLFRPCILVLELHLARVFYAYKYIVSKQTRISECDRIIDSFVEGFEL